MKQIIAILLACALLVCAIPVVSAAETEKVEVPKIYITTAGGNGTTLQKADGKEALYRSLLCRSLLPSAADGKGLCHPPFMPLPSAVADGKIADSCSAL